MNSFFKILLLTFLVFFSRTLFSQSCADLKVTFKITVIEEATCTRGGVIEWELDGPDADKIDASQGKLVLLAGKPTYSGNRISNVPGGRYSTENLPENSANAFSTKFLCPDGKSEKLININGVFEMPVGLSIPKQSGMICTDGTLHMVIEAINGSGDYTYTLKLPSGDLTSKNGQFDSKLSSADIRTTYKVLVADNKCAKANKEIDVKVDNYALSQTIIQGSPEVCLNSPLNLTANFPSSGTVEWYRWQTPSGIVETKELKIPATKQTDAGKYTLQVKIKECSDIYQEEINITVLSVQKPEVKIAEVCKNGSISLMDYVKTSGSDYELLWKVGNTTSTTAPEVNTSTQGDYEFFVQQRNKVLNCVSEPAVVTVKIIALPKAVKVEDINIFINPADPKPQISVSSESGYSYKLYTTKDGTDLVASYDKSPGGLVKLNNLIGLSLNTTYYLLAINANGCESETRTPVEIGDALKLVDGPKSVCFGSPFTLTSLVKGTVKWTMPSGKIVNETNLSIEAADLTHQGTYSIDINTDMGLLQGEFTLKVNKVEKPVVSKTLVEYCIGTKAGALEAKVEEGNTLKWVLPSGVTQSTAPVPSTTTAGDFIYKVQQITEQACMSDFTEITVRVHNLPQAVSPSVIQVCMGNIPTVNIKESLVGYTYELYKEINGEPFVSVVGTGGVVSLAVGVVETDVTYYIGVKNTNTCDAKDKTPVNIIAVSSLIRGTSSICEGKTIQLESPAIVGATYNWTRPNNTTYIGNPLPAIENAGQEYAGKYKLSIQVEGCSPVEHSFSFAIGKPELAGGQAVFEFCKGSNATSLSAIASTDCDLIWYNSSEVQLASAPTPSTGMVGTTVYYVAQSYKSDPTCIGDKKEIQVNIVELPTMQIIDPITACKGSYPSIQIENSVKNSTYSLFDVAEGGTELATVLGTGGNVELKTVQVADRDVVYYVSVSNYLGCKSEKRVPVAVTIADINIFPETLPAYQRSVFYDIKLETNAVYPYVFRVAEGSLPDGFEMSMQGGISGTAPATGSSEPRIFVVEVEDANSCKVTREYTLRTDLIVPEMFSPNNDGVNDHFMTGFHVTIFNRLGVKIFEGDNGWDGTRNGTPVPADIYFYIVRYVADDGSIAKKSGSIMLLKRE